MLTTIDVDVDVDTLASLIKRVTRDASVHYARVRLPEDCVHIASCVDVAGQTRVRLTVCMHAIGMYAFVLPMLIRRHLTNTCLRLASPPAYSLSPSAVSSRHYGSNIRR
jgi:hypothetical protein